MVIYWPIVSPHTTRQMHTFAIVFGFAEPKHQSPFSATREPIGDESRVRHALHHYQIGEKRERERIEKRERRAMTSLGVCMSTSILSGRMDQLIRFCCLHM